MKDIKLTLKATFANWKPWSKMLWRYYLTFAAVASALVYAFMRVCTTTLMPIVLLWSETHNWDFVLAVVGLDLFWVISFLLLMVAAIACSVLAHRQMKAFVSLFEKREMGKSHRNVLVVNIVLLLMGSVVVAMLPTVTIFVSYTVAALSGMMLDNIETPGWVHVAMLLCTLMGVLFCEVVATFARLCYRKIPTLTKETENEPEIPIVTNLLPSVSA